MFHRRRGASAVYDMEILSERAFGLGGVGDWRAPWKARRLMCDNGLEERGDGEERE